MSFFLVSLGPGSSRELQDLHWPPEEHKQSYRLLKASGMTQQVQVTAAKPDSLSSIPGTHMVKGKNRLRQAVPWLPQVCRDTYTK